MGEVRVWVSLLVVWGVLGVEGAGYVECFFFFLFFIFHSVEYLCRLGIRVIWDREGRREAHQDMVGLGMQVFGLEHHTLVLRGVGTGK